MNPYPKENGFLNLPLEIRRLVYSHIPLPRLIEVGKRGTRLNAHFIPYYVSTVSTISVDNLSLSEVPGQNTSLEEESPNQANENELWRRILHGLDPRAHWIEMWPHLRRWEWSEWWSDLDPDEDRDPTGEWDAEGGDENDGISTTEGENAMTVNECKDGEERNYDDVRRKYDRIVDGLKQDYSGMLRASKTIYREFMDLVEERVTHCFAVSFDERQIDISERYARLRKVDIIVRVDEEQIMANGLLAAYSFVQRLRTQIQRFENLEELRVILRMAHTKKYLALLNDFRDWAIQCLASIYARLPKLKMFLFVQLGSPTKRKDGFILDRKSDLWVRRAKVYEMPRHGWPIREDVLMDDV